MSHVQAIRDVRAARHRDRPTGLAAFLGRISGVELVRKAVHRYEDGKRLKAYQEQRAELKARHGEDARSLDTRINVQAQEAGRRLAALEKVERRELASFMRDQRTDQRVRDRGGDDTMPSLTALLDNEQRSEEQALDLLATFAQAKQSPQSVAPDLMRAFERAAQDRPEQGSGDSSQSAPEAPRPSDERTHDPGAGPEKSR